MKPNSSRDRFTKHTTFRCPSLLSTSMHVQSVGLETVIVTGDVSRCFRLVYEEAVDISRKFKYK